MKRVVKTVLSIVTVAFFAAGCSSVRLVDSDVTAFADWRTAPPAPGTPYRFERLPSQQAPGAQQDAVEGMARTALARVGMELNPSIARYSVQTVINTQIVDRGIYDGGIGYSGIGFGGVGYGGGVFLGGGSRGVGFGLSLPMRFPEYYYKRELTLQMRDLRTNQIAFESRALHDGVWSDTFGVLPAMLDSTLSGFPQPPPGTRRINIETPR
jgi:hypothetical protein